MLVKYNGLVNSIKIVFKNKSVAIKLKNKHTSKHKTGKQEDEKEKLLKNNRII